MITVESEAAFWNEPDMVSYFASKSPDPRVVDRMVSLDSSAAQTALDLGCGGGRHTQVLGEADFATTAVDVNPAMLINTAHRTRHIRDRVADIGFGSITGIPAPDDSFGIVVSTGALHQARGADEMSRAISEVARVGQKGGVFIGNIFVSDIWDDTYTIPDPTRPDFVETQQQVGMTLIDASRVIDMLACSGFALEEDPVLDFKLENTGPRGIFRFTAELTK